MRALVQRVSAASVAVAGEVVGEIGPGLCVFVAVRSDDDAQAADRLAEKLWHLRVFEDEDGRVNRSAADLDRELLVVSQFTLYADTAKGRRPSFAAAAPPEQAEPLIDLLTARLASRGAKLTAGRFRAAMAVTLTNDGPFTVLVDV